MLQEPHPVNDRLRRALEPTPAEIAALPITTNDKLTAELIGPGHDSALDIGCGDGAFTRLLVPLAQSIAAVDPNAEAITAAREKAAADGIRIDFRVGTGEKLPFPDHSFAVVAFSNSLHHMTDPRRALAEARRVIEPSGVLYVMEPVAAGNYQQLNSLVHDETDIRALSYRELVALEGADFAPVAEILYRMRRRFPSFAAWKSGQLMIDPERAHAFAKGEAMIEERFLKVAEREPDGFVFTQVFRVNVLKAAAARPA